MRVVVSKVVDADHLLFSLRDVTHGFLDRARSAAAAAGLGVPHMFAMRLIAARDGIRPGELAAALHMTPGSMTPIVQALAERGLIERRKDAQDGRIQHLHVTPDGKALRRTVEDHMRGILDAAFADWDDATMAQFTKGLDRLRQSLAPTPADA